MAEKRLVVQTQLSSLTLGFNSSGLNIYKPTKSNPNAHVHIIHHRILNATIDGTTRQLTLTYVSERKSKKYAHLVTINGVVDEKETAKATAWAEELLNTAYEEAGVKRNRRLLVYVNPFGGRGRGAQIYAAKVEPILLAAGCELEVIHTTRHRHALELAQKIELKYDAVLTVSGDGLIHEVLNGFAQHAQPLRALSIPIVPIPTGSGNGLAHNLLGLKDGLDVGIAALNAVKGRPMPVDLFSVTQGEKRSFSFFSQSLGLMADLDLGTDHLRWMGDTRFVYGLLRGVVAFKPCPIEVSVKLVESDKDRMVESLQIRNDKSQPPSPSETATLDGELPPLQYLDDDKGWVTFDEPCLYFYAGKGPYVSRDLMAFPVSQPDDGVIDITIMLKSNRGDIIKAMDGGPEGKCYWHPKLKYLKARAYRVKLLSKEGYLSVDGEPYEYQDFQLEVHQKLGHVLSPYGYYNAPFEPRASPDGENTKSK